MSSGVQEWFGSSPGGLRFHRVALRCSLAPSSESVHRQRRSDFLRVEDGSASCGGRNFLDGGGSTYAVPSRHVGRIWNWMPSPRAVASNESELHVSEEDVDHNSDAGGEEASEP